MKQLTSSGIRTNCLPSLIIHTLLPKRKSSLTTMTRLTKTSYRTHSNGRRKPTRKCSPPSIRNAPAGTANPRANLPTRSCPGTPNSTKRPNPSSTIYVTPPPTHPTLILVPTFPRITPSNPIRAPSGHRLRPASWRATTRKRANVPARGVESLRSETAICMRWHMAIQCIYRITPRTLAIPASQVACIRGTLHVLILRREP